ncbi:MAG: sulfurtransferase TusA family protein [Rhodospirillales bacterium]|nr:sulfurtransferase TusA family protein [Rhodospirillales bacterium]
MNKDSDPNKRQDVDFYLDITPETCPMTFVRSKLMIEKMAPGALAEIRLQGTEPLENVPRSVRDMGHEVVSLEPEAETTTSDGIHRLIVRKR